MSRIVSQRQSNSKFATFDEHFNAEMHLALANSNLMNQTPKRRKVESLSCGLKSETPFDSIFSSAILGQVDENLVQFHLDSGLQQEDMADPSPPVYEYSFSKSLVPRSQEIPQFKIPSPSEFFVGEDYATLSELWMESILPNTSSATRLPANSVRPVPSHGFQSLQSLQNVRNQPGTPHLFAEIQAKIRSSGLNKIDANRAQARRELSVFTEEKFHEMRLVYLQEGNEEVHDDSGFLPMLGSKWHISLEEEKIACNIAKKATAATLGHVWEFQNCFPEKLREKFNLPSSFTIKMRDPVLVALSAFDTNDKEIIFTVKSEHQTKAESPPRRLREIRAFLKRKAARLGIDQRKLQPLCISIVLENFQMTSQIEVCAVMIYIHDFSSGYCNGSRGNAVRMLGVVKWDSEIPHQTSSPEMHRHLIRQLIVYNILQTIGVWQQIAWEDGGLAFTDERGNEKKFFIPAIFSIVGASAEQRHERYEQLQPPTLQNDIFSPLSRKWKILGGQAHSEPFNAQGRYTGPSLHQSSLGSREKSHHDPAAVNPFTISSLEWMSDDIASLYPMNGCYDDVALRLGSILEEFIIHKSSGSPSSFFEPKKKNFETSENTHANPMIPTNCLTGIAKDGIQAKCRSDILRSLLMTYAQIRQHQQSNTARSGYKVSDLIAHAISKLLSLEFILQSYPSAHIKYVQQLCNAIAELCTEIERHMIKYGRKINLDTNAINKIPSYIKKFGTLEMLDPSSRYEDIYLTAKNLAGLQTSEKHSCLGIVDRYIELEAFCMGIKSLDDADNTTTNRTIYLGDLRTSTTNQLWMSLDEASTHICRRSWLSSESTMVIRKTHPPSAKDKCMRIISAKEDAVRRKHELLGVFTSFIAKATFDSLSMPVVRIRRNAYIGSVPLQFFKRKQKIGRGKTPSLWLSEDQQILLPLAIVEFSCSESQPQLVALDLTKFSRPNITKGLELSGCIFIKLLDTRTSPIVTISLSKLFHCHTLIFKTQTPGEQMLMIWPNSLHSFPAWQLIRNRRVFT